MQPPTNNQLLFHHHPNGIMTAPRPRGNGGVGFGDNVNRIPRKNLFSPNVGGGGVGSSIAHPPPQSNGKMKNHHFQQQLAFHDEENLINHHPPSSSSHHKHCNNDASSSSSYTPMKSQHGHATLAPFTPERTPKQLSTNTPGGLRDTTSSASQHQQHQCGLSAMISLETSYRTPSKSTTRKKHHRRNPSSVSRLFPTPTSATPMRTPATTTKKHKRSTSSMLMLSTPTRTTRTTTTTPMRTTPSDGASDMRDLIWALPNTDTKLMITAKQSSRSHRRTPSRFQLTPQKRIFETEDLSSSSSSSSSSDERDGSGEEDSSSGMETEDIVISTAAPTTSATATPKQKLRRTIPLPSPNLSALCARKKLKKQMTPPRQYYSSHAVDTNSNPDELGLLHTGFEGLEEYRMTSTELDPSNFQVELPSKKEVLVHAKICNLMNGYTAVQRDFNFSMLSGITRSTLEKEYDKSTNEDPMIAGICHRDVVKQVLECADDIVVEGFFREYGKVNKEESGGERIETCVFSSESLRQIIVCFRGSTAAQARPVKSYLFGREGE